MAKWFPGLNRGCALWPLRGARARLYRQRVLSHRGWAGLSHGGGSQQRKLGRQTSWAPGLLLTVGAVPPWACFLVPTDFWGADSFVHCVFLVPLAVFFGYRESSGGGTRAKVNGSRRSWGWPGSSYGWNGWAAQVVCWPKGPVGQPSAGGDFWPWAGRAWSVLPCEGDVMERMRREGIARSPWQPDIKMR